MENRTLYGTDDGLVVNKDVGAWTEEKYATIRLYNQIFTKSMRSKWGTLTYLDLYAGAGKSKVIGSGEVLLGSPLIALSVDVQFDHYIFCEADEEKLHALKQRVTEAYPSASTDYILGDCNSCVPEILNAIPPRALTLCIVDPYRMDIQFETLRRLSSGRNMDLLCLLASRMDVGRNPHVYPQEDQTRIDSLLGTRDWRQEWEQARTERAKAPNLGDFVTRAFADRLEGIGYLHTDLHEMKLIKRVGKSLLYHLALFSKHPKAKELWAKAITSSTSQRGLRFPETLCL